MFHFSVLSCHNGINAMSPAFILVLKIPIWVYFEGPCNEIYGYIRVLYGHLVFYCPLVHFTLVGICIVPRKIWQPWGRCYKNHNFLRFSAKNCNVLKDRRYDLIFA
jgi:hypothetical protein